MILITLLTFLNCQSPESFAITKVSELSEVKAYNQVLETDNKKMVIWIYSSPQENNGFYWIKVSEDNGGQLISRYNFFVSTKFEIKFYDTTNDKLLELDEWRKNLNKD
ncbi:MAG: hypothetical protein NXI20_00140 [bacterium]|nr:hypothetical protein [bacterium]